MSYLDDEDEDEQPALPSAPIAPAAAAIPSQGPSEEQMRQMLYARLMRQIGPQGEAQREAADKASIDRNTNAAMAKSLAQLGSYGGKVADTSALSDQAKSLDSISGGREKQMEMDAKVYDYLTRRYEEQQINKAKLAQQDKALSARTAENQQKQSNFDKQLSLKQQEIASNYALRNAQLNKENTNYELAGNNAEGFPVYIDKKNPTRVVVGDQKLSPKTGLGLPKDEEHVVTSLATKNAEKISIKNQLDQELSNLKNAWKTGNEDQAIAAGENMAKVLNSTEGKDAVGAEESKRLMGLLNYKVLNLTQPGSVFGRDVDAFIEQAAEKSNAIGKAVVENNKMIQRIKGGQGLPMDFQDQTLDIPKKGSAPPAAPTPRVGQEQGGYIFQGGDPAKPESWKKK